MFIFYFFLGIGMMVVGVLTLKNNYGFSNSFGRIGWAEDLLGPGRSFLVFKLVSIGMVFFGFLIAFGWFDNFFKILLNPIIDALFGSQETTELEL